MPASTRKSLDPKIKLAYFFIIAIVVLDQATKYFAVKGFSSGESIPLIKNVFHLTLVYNTGAAFGILSSRVQVFVLIAVLAVAVIVYYLKKKSHELSRFDKISLYFILGGTLGNLIDRLRVGAVIDFFDFRVWPVFNIADSFITIGACMLAFSMFRKGKHD